MTTNPDQKQPVNRFAPGMPDGPPINLPDALPDSWGEPALDHTGQREPVIYIPDAYGRMVPMPKSHFTAVPAAAPAPAPAPRTGVDPRAQILLATGPAAAGIGWGVGEAVNAASGVGTGTALVLAAAVLAAKVFGRKTINHVVNTTTVNANVSASWWGKASAPTNVTTNTTKR
ncbi:hypothetical protein ACFV3R_25270 [Streptomyces sp. NPDC059740]|uniref:hypothetical protein n=1 Tax=Streptomyces sp. NPDC059740 TaxID=3346926 RepID=UPI003669D83E